MIARCNIQNESIFEKVSLVLRALQVECSSSDNSAKPDLVMDDVDVEKESIPKTDPDTFRIGFVSQHVGWGAIAALYHTGYDEIVQPPYSLSNIYSAVWQGVHPEYRKAQIISSGVLAQIQFQRLTTSCNAPEEEPSFVKADSGRLARRHFSSILYDILTEHLTVQLHLWRPGIHWIIYFMDGHPWDIDTRESAHFFDVFAWAQQSRQIALEEFSDTMTRSERIERLPEPTKLLHDWMIEMLIEVFSWSDAEFKLHKMKTVHVPSFAPSIGDDEIMETLIRGVYKAVPLHLILDVTLPRHSLFLKLRDNPMFSGEKINISGAGTVVEKLKIGDTVDAMMIGADSLEVVHQTVYLVLVMGNLDLFS